MKFYSKLLFYTAILGLAGLSSCKKDEETSSSTVQFTELSKTATEADGQVSVALDLGTATTSDVVLQFSVSGTAVLNGDYTVSATTDSTLTIPKGTTSTNLVFTIIDDNAIESSKSLVVTLKSVSSAATLSSNSLDLTSTITITDNDTAPTSGMQVDLTWDAGSKVEMDLYLMTGVEFDTDGNITGTDQTNSLASENETGFQSISLPTTAVDGDYYIVIVYYSGSRAVTFSANVNGGGYTDESLSGSFSSSEVGYYTYATQPLVKSGSTYTWSAQSQSVLSKKVGNKTVQILKVSKAAKTL
ncbi:MAG: Calx-beta domain-containing protein [Siphonobacter sp.]